jgi:hypothetical protein
MEKIREKTDNSRENWKDLTPGGRKLLEKVAGQLVRKQGAEKWAPAMQRMGLAAPPEVTTHRNTASVVFPGPEDGRGVRSVMFWNVNGLRARWAARELGFKEGVCDWRNLAKMDGFEDWLREKEYRFCYFVWTGEDKTGIGKAGLAIPGPGKTTDVVFLWVVTSLPGPISPLPVSVRAVLLLFLSFLPPG